MKDRFCKDEMYGRRIKKPGVYLILNVVSKDVYVGYSQHVPRRWKSHLSAMTGRRHEVKRINELVDLYGVDSFRFLFLETVRCDPFYRENQWAIYLGATLSRSHLPRASSRART